MGGSVTSACQQAYNTLKHLKLQRPVQHRLQWEAFATQATGVCKVDADLQLQHIPQQAGRQAGRRAGSSSSSDTDPGSNKKQKRPAGRCRSNLSHICASVAGVSEQPYSEISSSREARRTQTTTQRAAPTMLGLESAPVPAWPACLSSRTP